MRGWGVNTRCLGGPSLCSRQNSEYPPTNTKAKRTGSGRLSARFREIKAELGKSQYAYVSGMIDDVIRPPSPTNILWDLNPYKAFDLDEIHPRVLKMTSELGQISTFSNDFFILSKLPRSILQQRYSLLKKVGMACTCN